MGAGRPDAMARARDEIGAMVQVAGHLREGIFKNLQEARDTTAPRQVEGPRRPGKNGGQGHGQDQGLRAVYDDKQQNADEAPDGATDRRG